MKNARTILAAGLAAFFLAGAAVPGGSAQTVNQNARQPLQTSASLSQNGQGTAVRQKASSGAKRYYIEFRARAAQSYGHTFLVHGRIGAKITPDRVVGLHPATESAIPWMIGHIILVPSETGASDGDTEDEYIIARYRLLLTLAEYRKALASIKQLQDSSPVWHAIFYNCNAFIADAAKAIGLQAPSSLLMPKEFIEALRDLNSGTRS